MRQHERYGAILFWLRIGAFMGMVLAAFLLRASVSTSVGLLAASGWVMRWPTSRAAAPLGLAFVGIGVLIIAGTYDIQDQGAAAVWVIGAGVLTLANVQALRIHAARALLPPTAEDLRREELESVVEEIRSSSMTTDPNHIEFTTQNIFSAIRWVGRLRTGDAAFELTYCNGDDFRDDREILAVRREEIDINPGGRTRFGQALKARFRIGDRRFKGKISVDAYERYQRWKATGGAR